MCCWPLIGQFRPFSLLIGCKLPLVISNSCQVTQGERREFFSTLLKQSLSFVCKSRKNWTQPESIKLTISSSLLDLFSKSYIDTISTFHTACDNGGLVCGVLLLLLLLLSLDLGSYLPRKFLYPGLNLILPT